MDQPRTEIALPIDGVETGAVLCSGFCLELVGHAIDQHRLLLHLLQLCLLRRGLFGLRAGHTEPTRHRARDDYSNEISCLHNDLPWTMLRGVVKHDVDVRLQTSRAMKSDTGAPLVDDPRNATARVG